MMILFDEEKKSVLLYSNSLLVEFSLKFFALVLCCSSTQCTVLALYKMTMSSTTSVAVAARRAVKFHLHVGITAHVHI